MISIESFSNPRFKLLKGLSKSRNRKKEERFLVEGRVELELAFANGWIPESVVFTEAYAGENEIRSLMPGGAKNALIQLSKALFDDLAYQQVPGNFLAIFKSRNYSWSDIRGMDVLVVLEHVEKPGNLGAVLRTCDALGIGGVVVTESEIDLYNPNVIRNSRGAVFTTPCVFASNEDAFGHLSRVHQVLAAALTDGAVPYTQIAFQKPLALVFGAESTGLSEFWLERAEQHIVIPMKGKVDSLNLSASMAIIGAHVKNS